MQKLAVDIAERIDALKALDQKQADWEAISAGIADMEAGRHQLFSKADAEFRAKYGIEGRRPGSP